MSYCPHCGAEIDDASDGLCASCGSRLSAESMLVGEQKHDLEPTGLPSRQPGMWRVWVSLVVFGGLVAVFFALVGLARLENAGVPAGEQPSAAGCASAIA